jgi:hypothetical protein
MKWQAASNENQSMEIQELEDILMKTRGDKKTANGDGIAAGVQGTPVKRVK